jgi:hypothetical protein
MPCIILCFSARRQSNPPTPVVDQVLIIDRRANGLSSVTDELDLTIWYESVAEGWNAQSLIVYGWRNQRKI